MRQRQSRFWRTLRNKMNPSSTAAIILLPLVRSRFASARDAFRYAYGLVRFHLNRKAENESALANRAEAWLNS